MKLTSDFVLVMDENYREIVMHDRLYGDKKQHSMNWLPYLKQLSLRPGAFKYSGVYDLMPEALEKYLDGCTGTDGQGFENPCRFDGQNKMESEIRNREKARILKLINTAGFYNIKTFEQFKFDEVTFPSDLMAEKLKTLDFVSECKNIIGFAMYKGYQFILL